MERNAPPPVPGMLLCFIPVALERVTTLNLRAFVRLFCLALFLSISLSVTASAVGFKLSGATIPFPGAYPTIQATIDAAQNGDTVLVADGTYSGPGNRDIDFHGKSLTVTSQNGPTKTIIDCGGYASIDGSGNHRGFYIHSAELNATINGFTVENGYEAPISAPNSLGNGGGIYISNDGNGKINLTNCTIIGNTALNGGGVCNFNNGTGAITLTNCTLSGNTSNYIGTAFGFGSNVFGGGVYNYNGGDGTITLTNCALTENIATYNVYNTGFGGGAYNVCTGNGTITLTNCTVNGNVALRGGGVYNDSYSGTIKLTNCTFSGNTAAYGGGGAGNRTSRSGSIALTNCTLSANMVTHEGNGGGGAENTNDVSSGTLTLTSCTISGNTAWAGGGISDEGSITLTNCTVSGNTASYSGSGGIVSGGGTITLTNDIIYGDTGGEIYNDQSALPIISFSDIKGGYAGTGNIDADPKFVNAATGDLHLQPGSACLGAGTATGAPAADKDGNPRPNPPSMGAYELGVLPAAITGFTLSPNPFLAVPGPNVFVSADVPVTGSFKSVSLTFAPGSFSGPTPTFKLNESSGRWTVSFPTNFLKLARANPLTLIATGVRQDGTTDQRTGMLQAGPLPKLTLNLFPNKSSIHRSETFTLSGYIADQATTVAPNSTVQVTLPQGINYVSSNGFNFDSSTRTLTLAVSPLLPNDGIYPLSILLQADANAPRQIALVMAASASCPGFQQATQNLAIVVEAGQIPLGVEVDARGGFGILAGTAVVDLTLGNTPLNATLTPDTSITSVLPIFGSTHRASIWLEVAVGISGGATYTPGGSGAAYFLAQNGLMAPSVSPTYSATFQHIGDSISVTASLTPRAAGLTLIDTMLVAVAAQSLKPIPNADVVFNVWNDVSQLSTFATVTNAFTKNPPKNKLQLFQAAARATKALLTMSGPEKLYIINILRKYKLADDFKVNEIDAFQKLLGRAFGAATLLQISADAFTIDGATFGDPMTVSFEAVAISNQQNQSAKGKYIVTKIFTRN